MAKIHVPPTLALRKAKNRVMLNRLLEEFDWRGSGYVDQWEWLTELYGESSDRNVLLARYHAQFIREGVI
jgi:hypothetical protein